MVRNTITGMDNIRRQIQGTSKRIERLGESSQEIGDIADQTNILALNAAIQASLSNAARQQASSSGHTSNAMQVIQEDMDPSADFTGPAWACCYRGRAPKNDRQGSKGR